MFKLLSYYHIGLREKGTSKGEYFVFNDFTKNVKFNFC